MQRILVPVIAAAILAGAAAPALAQGSRLSDWRPLADRQDEVARRIADGVASGALSDASAHDLSDQFKGLLNLESDYRKTGLTLYQREDLQARYDTLMERLRADAQGPDSGFYPAGHEPPLRAQQGQ
jgi:hypothetical protein